MELNPDQHDLQAYDHGDLSSDGNTDDDSHSPAGRYTSISDERRRCV
jgi:hypothetical protein